MRFYLWMGLGLFFSVFSVVSIAVGVEEELNLEKLTEGAPPVVIPKSTSPSVSVMGRLDLTAEVNAVGRKQAESQAALKNLHGLKLFLKLKASPTTSFFGEVANQDFYYGERAFDGTYSLAFGKIIVPFGDTRFFHHFYGGLQGRGAQGILLPNVWAETGLNLQSHWSPEWTVDLYLVNGVKAAAKDQFPDLLQGGDSESQAVGSRVQWSGWESVTVLASVYFDNYWEGRQFSLVGFDFYTDYGFFPLPLRVAGGWANARATQIPEEGTLNRRGDYLMLAGMGFGPGEWRVRYGTYNHSTKKVSEKDTQSLGCAYTLTDDVIRWTLERQWNYEAQNEVRNDLWRLMASLDF